MSTLTSEKTQLSVRVNPQVVSLLDAQIAKARQAGRRVTKQRLVSDAILAAYSDNAAGGSSFPVHRGVFAVQFDPRSNTALLDLLDHLEGTGQ